MDQLREDMPKTTTQKDLRKAYNGLIYDRVLETVQAIPSLNECLDKETFQKKINNLPLEHLNKIESQIAEDILMTYTSKKSKYQNERNLFFKKHVISSAEKIKENEEKYLHRI
jgi:hypothetical protein